MTQPGGSDVLTETERVVAELVAGGLSNRAIGGQMFLSRYTVDYHLRQIYRKLGIYTRAELATWVVASKRAAFTMFDGVMDGISVLEPIWEPAGTIDDFRFVYANAAAIDPVGQPVSDRIGQRLSAAYPVNQAPLYSRVFTASEPLALHDFHREETIDGVLSVTRFEIRASRYGSYVILAYRRLDLAT